MQCSIHLPAGHRLNLDPPHCLCLLPLCWLHLPPCQLYLLPLCSLHLPFQLITHTHCNSLTHALLLVIRRAMGTLHPGRHQIDAGFNQPMMLTTMIFRSFPPLLQFNRQHPLLALSHDRNHDHQLLPPQSGNILLKITHLSQAPGNDRGQGQE